MSGTAGQPGANPYEKAAGGMQQAGKVYRDVAAPGALRMSMNQFINPYTKQVIDDTTRGMVSDRDQALSQIGGDAARSGAFGGSRHGLVESEVYSTTNENIGNLTNQMLSERFNTAAGLGQQEINNRLAGAQAGQGLAGDYFATGNTIADRQAGVGSQQQQLAQAILSQGNKQYDTYAGYPQQSLNNMLAAISGSPLAGNQSKSYTPGLLDWASLGTQGASAYMGGKGG